MTQCRYCMVILVLITCFSGGYSNDSEASEYITFQQVFDRFYNWSKGASNLHQHRRSHEYDSWVKSLVGTRVVIDKYRLNVQWLDYDKSSNITTDESVLYARYDYEEAGEDLPFDLKMPAPSTITNEQGNQESFWGVKLSIKELSDGMIMNLKGRVKIRFDAIIENVEIVEVVEAVRWLGQIGDEEVFYIRFSVVIERWEELH